MVLAMKSPEVTLVTGNPIAARQEARQRPVSDQSRGSRQKTMQDTAPRPRREQAVTGHDAVTVVPTLFKQTLLSADRPESMAQSQVPAASQENPTSKVQLAWAQTESVPNKMCTLNIGPVGFNLKGRWCVEEVSKSSPAIVMIQDLKRQSKHLRSMKRLLKRICPQYRPFFSLADGADGAGVMLLVHERLAVRASQGVLQWIAPALSDFEINALQGRFVLVKLLDPHDQVHFFGSLYMPTTEHVSLREAILGALTTIIERVFEKYPLALLTVAGDCNAAVGADQRVGYSTMSKTFASDEAFKAFLQAAKLVPNVNRKCTYSANSGMQQAA